MVELPNSIQISSVNLPSSQIVFERSTGEIAGFDPTQNQFVIQSAGGTESYTIVFNELGVIVQANWVLEVWREMWECRWGMWWGIKKKAVKR